MPLLPIIRIKAALELPRFQVRFQCFVYISVQIVVGGKSRKDLWILRKSLPVEFHKTDLIVPVAVTPFRFHSKQNQKNSAHNNCRLPGDSSKKTCGGNGDACKCGIETMLHNKVGKRKNNHRNEQYKKGEDAKAYNPIMPQKIQT